MEGEHHPSLSRSALSGPACIIHPTHLLVEDNGDVPPRAVPDEVILVRKVVVRIQALISTL